MALLLLSGFSYKGWAQQDSTKLSLLELKHTAQLLIELEARRYESDSFLDKENIYKNIIKDYQNDQELFNQQIENLELIIEAVTPAWYDHFWIGAAITGIVVSSIYFLAKQ